MKKINIDILLLTSVMCLLPILFGLYFYLDLPDYIAVHFNINNQPDGFMPKEMFVFGLPLIMMFTQIFICIIMDLKSTDTNNKSVLMYKLMIPVICAILYVVIILFAMTYGINIGKITAVILGVMFVAIGIDLPNADDAHLNFPRIKNEQVYLKTKKTFGIVIIIDGLLSLICALVNERLLVGVVLLLVIQSMVLLFYTAWFNGKEEAKK